ncbi:MAG: FecR domain-containing protein [Campylobacterales bacterium]
MKTKFILPLLLILQTLLFASVGKITAVNGDVSVLRATKTIKAASGFVLEEKDGIKSQKGSSAQIVFNDKTVITVGSDTLFKVEEYSADAASPKARFGVGEGTFKAVTGKIGKIAPDKFKIETKTATIGIRGTTLAGRVLPSGETLVMCMRGAITVSPNIPTPPPPVVVNQGQITRTNMGFVQPAVQITPEDMRNIQGGLAPFASNTTQTNNGGDGGGQGQPQPQNQPPQNTAIPNLDTIKDLTTKAVDNLVNDGVKNVAQTQTITPEYIDSLPYTKYLELPATGLYSYKTLKTGDTGAGYINMETGSAFYSYFGIYNGRLDAEFGVGGITSDDAGNAKLNFEYAGYGDNYYGFESTFTGEQVGYLKGADALYARLSDIDRDNNATYISGEKYTNIAANYGSVYTLGSSGSKVYDMVGKISTFRVSMADYNSFGITKYVNAQSVSDFYLIWSDGSIMDHSTDVTNGRSSFVSEDAFGFGSTNGSSAFVTTDDVATDYASWGYWYKIASPDFIDFGFWVGGASTLESELNNLATANSIATYNGKVMGGVASNGSGFDLINTATSSVNLTVEFGNNYPLSGNIAFSTASGQSWNLSVDQSTSTKDFANAAFGASFNTGMSTSTAGTVSGGSLSGNFYGPNAATIGGGFNAATSNGYNASGVFKANKQ